MNSEKDENEENDELQEQNPVNIVKKHHQRRKGRNIGRINPQTLLESTNFEKRIQYNTK